MILDLQLCAHSIQMQQEMQCSSDKANATAVPEMQGIGEGSDVCVCGVICEDLRLKGGES